ncbi:hypothetical protein C8R45DRAFT_1108528 [Mycena sanguinolenta]|nr:hypothetical protein C8R45DRAFT_1108528 [Mycena sanguinolenta]
MLLHGMLFIDIQFDDFQLTLPWFIGRLEIKAAEEREWNMMAIVNVSAVLEYSKPTGVLKKASVQGTCASTATQMRIVVANFQSPAMSEAEPDVQVALALLLLCATAHLYDAQQRKPSL